MTESDAKHLAERMRRRAVWLRKQVDGFTHAYADAVRTWAADLEKFAEEIHQEEK